MTNDFLKSGTSESITRLSFFSIVMMLLVWETYAVFAKTTVPHIGEILTFTAAILVNKQYQERKTVGSVVSDGVPNMQ